MPTVHNWSDIAEGFNDTLLLGNGASMAVDPCFSYRSLREAAESNGLITDSIKKVFDFLDTQDFELVMSMIWHAYFVNQALGVADEATARAYREVRAALVGAVRDRHADFDVARPHLGAIATFMQRFETVLSLNYDLIVYWAMLEGNEELGNWFKDCFIREEFDDDWERLRKPLKAEGTTLVFYPHGNLALTTSLMTRESKVTRKSPNESLLACVLRAWQDEERIPLFVSEGESRQKELAILRSGYLSTVYNAVLPTLGPTFAIYGWSVSDNDAHILKRICRAKTERIAFSVFRGDRRMRDVEIECDEIALKIRRINPDIETLFYWSDSADCWLLARCGEDEPEAAAVRREP